jgi:LemA protein
MKKGWIILIVVVVVVLAVVGYLFSAYNQMVTLSQSTDAQWAQVETQYQRRFDLIPGLVNAVKGIMNQEQKVFGDLAAARTQYSGAKTVNDQVAAANQVESSLGRLLAVVENYPDLKSSEAVQTFMAQFEGTENRISVEQMRFNDEVKGYDTLITRIPGAWLASWFGFVPKSYFQSVSGGSTVPSTNFSN